MNIQIHRHPGSDVAALAGEIDGSTAPLVREAVAPLLAPGAVTRIDMTGVHYLSSAGLRALLLLQREAEARGALLILSGISREIRGVMSSTGFLGFFQLEGSALGEIAG